MIPEHELRDKRNVGIIKQFADIEATGDLPTSGFHWDTIKWEEGKGWRGYVVGPGGATAWIRCRKIPDGILGELE